MVNRVWQPLRQRVVATSGDFGTLGEGRRIPNCSTGSRSEFMAEGWSIKRLIRAIVPHRDLAAVERCL